MIKLDVAIIGAGPSGLAAAIELLRKGISNIMIFERNQELGGLLNQCIHTGFGIKYYKNDFTGPQYAKKIIDLFLEYKIPYKTNAMVIDLTRDKILTVSSPEGLVEYKAETVIIATGCRERTRENLEISGTRPAGIFTAGQSQNLINLKNYKIGKKVIIQGSGDIGLIMARRLIIEGYNVVKVFERMPFLNGLIRNKIQCLDYFDIPIIFKSQIIEIKGNDRVEGVITKQLDQNLNFIEGSEEFYSCDTLLFSVGLIPEIEIAKKAGVISKNNFNPVVNNKYETNVDGIFICGNALHINHLADDASMEGEKTAGYVNEYLNNIRRFKKNISNHVPYKNSIMNTRYTENFFKDKNKNICIICPKSCILENNSFGCKRGKKFLEKNKKECFYTTTIFSESNGIKKRIPLISEKEIPVELFVKIKSQISKNKIKKNTEFEITLNNEIFTFKEQK